MDDLKKVKTGKAGMLCAAAGAVVFGIGFVTSGFNFSKLSTVGQYDKKTMTASADTKQIEIYEDDTNIKLSRSDDNEIHVIYYENKDQKYNITEGDTLKIKKKSKNFIVFGINTQNISLEVQLPEKCQPDIKINSDTSNIKADNISADSCEISVSDGNLKLNDCDVNGKTDLSTDTGNVTVCGMKFAGEFKTKTGDGNVTTENCDFGDKSQIKTGCGNVNVQKISCEKDFDVKTSDGNVKGTINGSSDDFNIDTKTSDGKNNLKNTDKGKDKTLGVKTGCGNIKIEFE